MYVWSEGPAEPRLSQRETAQSAPARRCEAKVAPPSQPAAALVDPPKRIALGGPPPRRQRAGGTARADAPGDHFGYARGLMELATTDLASLEPLAASAAQLVVSQGPDQGSQHPVRSSGTRVGSGVGVELRLADPTVSRIHCSLSLDAGRLRVRDEQSTNGTFVDGVRVHDAELEPGSLLQRGQSVLRLEVASQPAPLELSCAGQFGGLIGASVAMRRVYSILERVAKTNTTLLIHGETGTGKELAARSIHGASARAEQAFVVVDCGAIASNLIESELFGHVRGAFTGADRDRKGLLHEAQGGTLFLDEIGELPLALQPKLLRMLESRELRRVGSSRAEAIDIRVVAATNRRLAQQVNAGLFREDLYYRLAVVEVELPALRQRREDVPALAQHFAQSMGAGAAAIPAELLSSWLTRSWPGNVRELRNVVERSLFLGVCESSEVISHVPAPELYAPLLGQELPLEEARRIYTEQFDIAYLTDLLRRSDGNMSQAARLAQVNRRQLYRMLSRLGLRSQDLYDD